MMKRTRKIRFSGTRKKVCAPKSKFRKTLCTSQLRAPWDENKYMSSPNCVPGCLPNEIDYQQINVETNSYATVSTRTTSFTWKRYKTLTFPW